MVNTSPISGMGRQKILPALLAFGERSGALEKKFRRKLQHRGFRTEQVDALIAITPEAGFQAIRDGVPIRRFLTDAASAAGLISVADIEMGQVEAMLDEYRAMTAPVLASISDAQGFDLTGARTQLYQALQLIVARSFSDARRRERDLLSDLMEAEQKHSDAEAFIRHVLKSIVDHFGGAGAAIDKFSVRGRGRAADVWSVSENGTELRLETRQQRNAQPAELTLLRQIIRYCSHVLSRAAGAAENPLRMVEVEEMERRRIARELHDNAGQSLVVLRLQLELLEMSLPDTAPEARSSLVEIRTVMEQTILRIRRLISELSPAALSHAGFETSIRQLAKRFRSGYPCAVRLRVGALPQMDSRLELVIYRMLQECFLNISRHSGARNIIVSLTAADERIRLSIADDGSGFNPEEDPRPRNRFGLARIREQVGMINGRLWIESPARKSGTEKTQVRGGTKITIDLPTK